MDDGQVVRPLPLRCAPHADESVSGFILRLAHRNSLDVPGAIVTASGIRRLPELFPTAEQLATLASLAGVELGDLEGMAASRIPVSTRKKASRLKGIRVPRNWLTTQRRACPECLTGSPYHRLIWDVVHVRACSIHSCELIHTCGECRKPLSWGRADLTRCSCGHDISRHRSLSCDAASADCARWIGGRFLGQEAHPPLLLEGVPFIRAVAMVTLLGAAFTGCLERDVKPFGGLGKQCHALGFAAFDGDLEHFRRFLLPVLDKPMGREWRCSKVALFTLSMYCRSLGLEQVAAIVEEYAGMALPVGV